MRVGHKAEGMRKHVALPPVCRVVRLHLGVLIIKLIYHLLGIDHQIILIAHADPKILAEKIFDLRGNPDPALGIDLIFVSAADKTTQGIIPLRPYDNTFYPFLYTYFLKKSKNFWVLRYIVVYKTINHNILCFTKGCSVDIFFEKQQKNLGYSLLFPVKTACF